MAACADVSRVLDAPRTLEHAGRERTEHIMRRVSSTESVPDTVHDTLRVPVLADLQQKFLNETATNQGVNPYQSIGSQAVIRERAPRRTLDDMRHLSEIIKRARAERTEADVLLRRDQGGKVTARKYKSERDPRPSPRNPSTVFHCGAELRRDSLEATR